MTFKEIRAKMNTRNEHTLKIGSLLTVLCQEKRRISYKNVFCFSNIRREHRREHNFKQTRHILIRYLDVELLFGLAESRTVKFSGHFNQVVAAEQEISFTSCSWTLKQKAVRTTRIWTILNASQAGGLMRRLLFPLQWNNSLLPCKLNRDAVQCRGSKCNALPNKLQTSWAN